MDTAHGLVENPQASWIVLFGSGAEWDAVDLPNDNRTRQARSADEAA